MSRIIFVAMMLAVAIAGCNRFPDLTLQVTANLQPDDTNCSVSATQEEVVPRGQYDLAIVRDYLMTPRIESYLVDNTIEIQAPQSNISVTGFDVTIKLPDGVIPELSGGLPNPYTVTSTVVIPPSEAIGQVSSGAALARMIPANYHQALVDLSNASGFDSIVIDVRANGTTSGGFSNQSPPFSWPIDFCSGCLGTTCPPPAEVGDGVGCFPGQDNWQYCVEIVDPEATP